MSSHHLEESGTTRTALFTLINICRMTGTSTAHLLQHRLFLFPLALVGRVLLEQLVLELQGLSRPPPPQQVEGAHRVHPV